MARTEPVARLEVATCPMHRTNVKHYSSHEVGCDCLNDDRRADLVERLNAARAEGNPLAEDAD